MTRFPQIYLNQKEERKISSIPETHQRQDIAT